MTNIYVSQAAVTRACDHRVSNIFPTVPRGARCVLAPDGVSSGAGACSPRLLGPLSLTSYITINILDEDARDTGRNAEGARGGRTKQNKHNNQPVRKATIDTSGGRGWVGVAGGVGDVTIQFVTKL